MMTAFTVKNVPEDLYKRLRTAARAHHRSVNGEIIACLENVLMPRQPSPEEKLETAKHVRQRVKATRLTSKEIDTAKRTGRS